MNRYPHLDTIRSIAILLVLIHHADKMNGPQWFQAISAGGFIGVDIFFVLSGWLIAGQLFRSIKVGGQFSLWKFYIRRWLRTLPVYYAMMLLLFSSATLFSVHGIIYLFFLQNYLDPFGWLITWSLCIEEHFYLIFPLLVLLVMRTSKPVLVAIILFMIGFCLPILLRAINFEEAAIHDSNWRLKYLGFPTHLRLEGLTLGVGLAAIATWYSDQLPSLFKVRGFAVLGFLIILFNLLLPYYFGLNSESYHTSFWIVVLEFPLVSIGAGLLVLWATSSDCFKFNVPGTHFISEHAYTLYLCHWPVAKLIQEEKLLGSHPFIISFPLYLFISILFAMIIRTLIEKPGLWLREKCTL